MEKFLEEIEEVKKRAEVTAQQKIEEVEKHREVYLDKLEQLKLKLPKIEESFAAKGLYIESLSYSRSGLTLGHHEDAQMSCSIGAKRLNKKFRFLRFSHYVNGNSSNQRRREKARKLGDDLGGPVGIKMHINEFSLELDRDVNEDDARILVNFWI